MMTPLESFCQRLEHIEIHYYVSHYEAQLWRDCDDENAVIVGNGDDIESAMNDLRLKLQGWTLQQVRQGGAQ